jgi:hypothetical protein
MLPGEFPARVRAISVALVLLASPVLAGGANDPVLEAKVDAYLNPLVEKDLIGGFVLIARGGEVLLSKRYISDRPEDGLPLRSIITDRALCGKSLTPHEMMSDVRRFPDDETLVVALFNRGSIFAREALRGLSAIAMGEEHEPLLQETDWALNPTTLWSFEGDYQVVPGYVITITAEQGELFLKVPEGKKCRALPLSDRRFFFEDVNAMVTFEPKTNGETESLRLRNGAHVFPARRVEWSEVGNLGRRARL